MQEALTNTLKHADAANDSVHLHYAPDVLQVEVVDDWRHVAAHLARAAAATD